MADILAKGSNYYANELVNVFSHTGLR